MNLIHLRALDTPLQGINLIEASAGTGKTYTIETLFIRLLIEKKLPCSKILVVTFTNAATEELRQRIRRRIIKTLTAFEKGNAPKEDETLSKLLERHTHHQQVTRVLRYALQSFDEAAIFTIHGFCLRVLHDHAFESGVLFETTLLNDQRPLLREIVEDFWRQHFYEASSLFINYVLGTKYKHPHHFLPVIAYGRHLNQPYLKITPPQSSIVTTTQENDFLKIFEQAKMVWQNECDNIQQLLLQDPSLNRTKYKQTAISNWCQELTVFFNSAIPSLSCNWLEKFTTTHLADSVKKGKSPPQHPFFALCDMLFNQQRALAEQFSAQLLTLKGKLFSVATDALAQKKRQHNFQSFDDLLINLNRALQGDAGSSLAQQIHQKYPVALIDEFQDTDPVQYQIFHRIYEEAENPTLFFIGDPKQAIYSFRGADIFTYMDARRDAFRQYTLDINRRSDAGLVKAINTLFQQITQPFIFDDIQFQKVNADLKHQKSRLYLADTQSSPLQIWFISKAQAECESTKPITKTWAKPNIELAIGHEITRLLHLAQNNQAFIQEKEWRKPLEAGDIAILVRTNKQAQSMQKTLTQLRIPSVLYSGESLFVSHEVMEIERILLAIANPTEIHWLKVALVTDLLGFSGNDLYQEIEDEQAWQKELNRFQKYHTLWRTNGFMPMFRTLLVDYAVPKRLLAFSDGERRLTNVLHATELLQQVSVQQKITLSHLCQWLAQQRQSQDEVTEEEQLRLESDEKRVKIVTIHKSKGLEYPIVFCPFVWDGKLYEGNSEQFTFHDGDNQNTLTLDLGSPEQKEHRHYAITEERAENIRLFYVAVTRAKHRCYLVWGGMKGAKTSAPAHLWYSHLEDVEKAEDEVLQQTLSNLIETAEQTIALSPLPIQRTIYQPATEIAPILTARSFLGPINKTWRVASFTSIAKQLPVDLADHDHAVSVPVELISARSSGEKENPILDFPKGAKAGIFFHALFEKLDFTQFPPDQAFITQQLQNFGYDPEKWQAIISQFITQVVTTPLEPQRPDFMLSSISHEQRLNELEFYYPLNPEILSAIKTEISTLRPVFTPTQGVMKGFIDLVFQDGERFYLVDYKSNFLGEQMQAYHHIHLENAMAQEGYVLQYHIYMIALHRYLQTRLPDYEYERHFGGVFYLFLRGMNPHWGSQYGIFRARPSVAFIENVRFSAGTEVF